MFDDGTIETRHADAVAHLLQERERGGFEALAQIVTERLGWIELTPDPDAEGYLCYVTAPETTDPDKYDPDKLWTALGFGVTCTAALTDALADVLILQGTY